MKPVRVCGGGCGLPLFVTGNGYHHPKRSPESCTDTIKSMCGYLRKCKELVYINFSRKTVLIYFYGCTDSSCCCTYSSSTAGSCLVSRADPSPLGRRTSMSCFCCCGYGYGRYSVRVCSHTNERLKCLLALAPSIRSEAVYVGHHGRCAV